jgi:arabinofuranosyltransferase
MHHPNSYKSLLSLAILIVTFMLFAYEASVIRETIDDAFISYRYASNFANGFGLVYNIGEYVEGYTNLLWTLLVAVGIYLGGDAVTIGKFLSICSSSLLLYVAYTFTRSQLSDNSKWLAPLAPLLIVVTNSFVSWSLSGLEQVLFAAVIILGLHLLVQGKFYPALLLSFIATLIRPDGLLLTATIGLFHGYTFIRENKIQQQPLQFLAPAFVLFLFLGLMTLWRWFYYADVLPNTFYAKVGGVPASYGLTYMSSLVKNDLLPLLIFLPFMIRFVDYKKLWPCMLFVLINLAYVFAVGGDVFANGRFLLPALCIYICLCISILGKHQQLSKASVFILACTVLANAAWSMYGPLYNNLGERLYAASGAFPQSYKHENARALNSIPTKLAKSTVNRIKNKYPEAKTIASAGIGAIGFYSDYIIIDLVGLIDKRVAKSKESGEGHIMPGHQRSDVSYVMSRNPDVILIAKKGNSSAVVFPAISELWRQEALTNDYFWDYRIGGYIANRLRTEESF